MDKRQNTYEVASEGWKVADKALRAAQEGLAGKARDLLLESDIAAFGSRGVSMELELLLRTGRPKAVAEWRQLSEAIWPKLRGTMVPADLFDEVKRLRDEYRKAHPGSSAAGMP